VSEGALKPAEYDAMVRDLVNFMVYMGEPAKLVRYGLGIKVLLFLMVFAGLAYMVKREYWRDIH
jgi:ubiquinol-cytochrome c reductase cytochrome c1 subunit